MELPLAGELVDRFCYWRGLSGRRYIHTIYAASECPPLPGSVFVAVGRDAQGQRRPLAAGRLSALWDLSNQVAIECNEVHVHLLAGSDREAQAVAEDLRDGLGMSVESPAAAIPEPRPQARLRRSASDSSRGSLRPISRRWPTAELT